jgi:hypothetical protein
MKKTWNYDEPFWVNLLGYTIAIILAIGIAFGLMCLSGWLIMLLWNAILPTVFSGVSAITFWKAVGIDILLWLLFGGLGKIILALWKN